MTHTRSEEESILGDAILGDGRTRGVLSCVRRATSGGPFSDGLRAVHRWLRAGQVVLAAGRAAQRTRSGPGFDRALHRRLPVSDEGSPQISPDLSLDTPLGRSRSLPAEPAFRQEAELVQQAAREVCRIHGLRIRVHGEVPSYPAVLICNHVSYLDPLVIASAVPTLSIAKHELRTWPILGSIVANLGTLFVERSKPMKRAITLRQAIRRLLAGVSVLNFPEGTTSSGDRLLPFYRGIFGAARIASRPIVPIFLEYQPRSLAWVGASAFLGHYLRFSLRAESEVSIRFGPPIDPQGERSASDLAQVAARSMETLGGVLTRQGGQ